MSFLFYSNGEETVSPTHNMSKTNIKEANGHIQALFDKVNGLELERDELLERTRQGSAELVSLAGSVNQLQEAAVKKDLAIKNLQLTIAEKDAIIDELNLRTSQLCAKSALNASQDITKLNDTIDELRSDCSAFEEKSSSQEIAIKDLTQQQKEVWAAKELLELKCKDLEEELEAKNKLYLSLEAEKASQNVRLQNAEKQVVMLKNILNYTSMMENLLQVFKETASLELVGAGDASAERLPLAKDFDAAAGISNKDVFTPDVKDDQAQIAEDIVSLTTVGSLDSTTLETIGSDQEHPEEHKNVGELVPVAGKQAQILEEQMPVVEKQAPVVEEQVPVVEEQVPVVEEQALAVEEQALAGEEQDLAGEEQALAVEEQALAVEEQAPVVEEQGPVVEEQASDIEEQALAEEQAPVVEEQAPIVEAVVEEVVADLVQVVEQPPAEEAQALVGEKTPAVGEEPAAVGEEPAAVGEEQAPVREEQAPVGEEQVPVGEEEAPLGGEQAHADPTSVLEEQAVVTEKQEGISESPSVTSEESAPSVTELGPESEEQAPVTEKLIPVAVQEVPVEGKVSIQPPIPDDPDQKSAKDEVPVLPDSNGPVNVDTPPLTPEVAGDAESGSVSPKPSAQAASEFFV